MTKYLVDVYLPSAGSHIDVLLPSKKPIAEVTELIIKLAETALGGSYMSGEHSVLLSADSGTPLDLNCTVFDAGIRNASKLILV